MGIKSFLFLVATAVLINACQTGSKRPEQQPQPRIEDHSFPQTLPQVTSPPTSGNPLTVGVYLGPGALRTYAEIGVLRALQKAKIPIVAIGGMEWGSIMAASFALSRGTNEVEWEMMKLRRDQLPSETLLSHELRPKDSQELFNFLNSAFSSKNLDSGSIPFRCSTTDGENVEFISQGKAREQLLKCATLPPLYSFYQRAGRSYVSGVLSPGDWPAELRKLGAQFIIYVDVISRGSFIGENYKEDPELKALWYGVKAISKQQHLFANLTLEVPSNMALMDYDHRRDAIALGEQVAQGYISTLSNMIGLH